MCFVWPVADNELHDFVWSWCSVVPPKPKMTTGAVTNQPRELLKFGTRPHQLCARRKSSSLAIHWIIDDTRVIRRVLSNTDTCEQKFFAYTSVRHTENSVRRKTSAPLIFGLQTTRFLATPRMIGYSDFELLAGGKIFLRDEPKTHGIFARSSLAKSHRKATSPKRRGDYPNTTGEEYFS